MNRLTKCILLISCVLMISCAKKSEIIGKPAEYKSDNVSMKGYLVYDNKINKKRPGVLVLHEWWGQDENVRKRAQMLAQMGYTALVVDMYGDGITAKDPEEAAKHAKEITGNLDLEKSRYTAAINFLKQQETVDPDRIAAIGYSFGGHIALDMARYGADIDAVVTFYGGITLTETQPPAQPGAIKAKILICQGEKDWYMAEHAITGFTQEMKHAGADFKIITYKDAEHGFANPDAKQVVERFKLKYAYDEQADKKSWADMQEFLKSVFGK